MDGSDIGGAIEVVVGHFDEPIHLKLIKHGGALPSAVSIIGDFVQWGNLGFGGPGEDGGVINGSVDLTVGGFEEIPLGFRHGLIVTKSILRDKIEMRLVQNSLL